MRRIVIIVPDLLAYGSLRQKLDTVQAMAELGRVVKLCEPPLIQTPEALLLGMEPKQGQLNQGPLTVAALGVDPPPRSTHFHLTPMSYSDGIASEIDFEIDFADQRTIFEQSSRLNTKSLTLVEGFDRDHGLVWEGLGDLETISSASVSGMLVKGRLPEGDAESQLRRFIDDSTNLLSELPLNERRLDEGLPPINLLWPWGHGVRGPVPNLALERGEPVEVTSGSLRLAGLARLAGYRHGDWRSFGRGVNVRLESHSAKLASEAVGICCIESASELVKRDRPEEVHWLAKEIDEKLLRPLFEMALKESTRILFLVPEDRGGLGLVFETGVFGAHSMPFDERALEEKSVPTGDLASTILAGLTV